MGRKARKKERGRGEEDKQRLCLFKHTAAGAVWPDSGWGIRLQDCVRLQCLATEAKCFLGTRVLISSLTALAPVPFHT